MRSSTLIKAIRAFPLLHKGLRAAYWERQYAKSPKKCPQGFLLNGLPSMQTGEFEPSETREVLKLLEEVRVFVNVGANVGYYVCLARQAEVKTVAIEPLEQNVQILMRNLLANHWSDVDVLPVAAGHEASLMKLYGGGTAASLIQGWAGVADDHCRIVPVLTLDSMLGHRFAGEQMLILIDIEGFELNALRGATNLLERTPRPIWFVEICINEHLPSGLTVNPHLRETFEVFWKHGYHAEFVGPSKREVTASDINLWSRGEAIPAEHNFVFRHDASFCTYARSNR
jgi:FkbM family methyltransferase